MKATERKRTTHSSRPARDTQSEARRYAAEVRRIRSANRRRLRGVTLLKD